MLQAKKQKYPEDPAAARRISYAVSRRWSSPIARKKYSLKYKYLPSIHVKARKEYILKEDNEIYKWSSVTDQEILE